MKFYKSKLFWFFILGLIIVSTLIYGVYTTSRVQLSSLADLFKENQTSEQSINKTYSYTHTNFYIPVSGVKSTTQNISSSDLQGLMIFTLENDLEEIKKIQGFENLSITTYSDFDKLSENLSNNLAAIGILNFSEANFRVKTLSFDGISLVEKNADLNEYKLKTVETFTSKEETENQSNYRASDLKIVGHTGSIIGARGTQYTAETKFKGDYTKLFEPTKPILDKMDFVSATMEAPFMGKGRECDHCMSFLGPDKIMDGIKYAGIDLLSTGANHIMDGGLEALENTQKKIAEAGILQTGSSLKNNDEAGKPVLANVNGLKIAYLAFNDTPGRSEWAGENNPGAAAISDWEIDSKGRTIKYEPNEERIKYFLQRAKELNPDLIFVIPHWGGAEYTQKPTEYVRNLARLLIKHGADAILGDHPHWVQEMEYIDGKPVWYCVGNYVFDQTWSEETMQGFTIELDIYQGKIVNFRLHPHYVKVQGVPVPVKPGEPKYQQIMDRIWGVSELR